jgi:triose/dihydroxyacetone kinase / FAD-AMP lyase (cyclizing)
LHAFSNITVDRTFFQKTVSAACANVVAQEATITQHDRIVGDGDCGVTLARGAKAVEAFVTSSKTLPGDGDAVATFRALTAVVENNMDGTSGALYSIFFAALTAALARQASGSVLNFKAWVAAVSEALSRLQQATPARQGDRTLMDALEPFVRTLEKSDGTPTSLAVAVAQAKTGVEATKGMKASLGRSVYVEASNWEAVPDPGAVGVLAILEGILSALS